jgi:glyoxylase-like metal-dependent hydrolase (beta-lactamase superfamily II)
MTVRIMDCGSMSTDLTGLLLKPGRTIRSRYEQDKVTEWYSSPTYCVLVETPDGRLLWDTSCPRDWERRWPAGAQDYCPYDQVSDGEYFDDRLHQLGVSLADIDYVVLSHLHADHAGNVRMFEGTNARLVCHQAEYDYAFGFDGPYEGAHIKADYEGLDFEKVSDDGEFLPGVRFISAPGHTPGSIAMQVELPDTGTMIFTSDAVYMGDSYGPPVAPPAIVQDLAAWYASVEKIRAVADQTDAMLVFGHDSAQLHTLRTAPEGCYT